MTVYKGRFLNRTAVIAGGASGLGHCVATRLMTEGARISLWDWSAETLAGKAAELNCCHSCVVDVTDADQVAQAGRETNSELGRIDILVVAAGITGPTVSTWEYPPQDWRRVIDINLNGSFHCCRAIVPYMMTNDYGRIVNIASVAGKEGNPNASAYSSSKAGVIALTKSLGKELARTGIRVNCVTPAVFKSPLLAQMPKEHIDFMASKIPMGRLGEVDEVAALICWLASDECTFSTSATFDISGGRSTY
jgi:NAD(P)-dependent dehydrogenase (short-subunit alcohol dehydrogenase family)